ncbi:nuclear transport factor 2 family protein [Sabulilitoribacter multivorans]|uniref:Nuclear transport factor 2 family protein n=1 Tax=Flaviramulus multivorans TaxID=1304750 RepID=A0ABS9IID0_9FLAO|nr:nuclear transport factor 2 family protein [Flaviramulus multivorans]MCF7560138.1 nuclear transport factor 2 family protein [Flaviramulus multivorans]
MKKSIVLFVLLATFSFVNAQSNAEKESVEKACLNYIEGFYEGDESKLKASLQPSLNKFGFWKNKEGDYEQQNPMSFENALAYARIVLEKKQFPKPDAPKKVEVLDVGNSIASAKITAWWGIDYILLSKRGDKWMIEQVLWEGPLEKS